MDCQSQGSTTVTPPVLLPRPVMSSRMGHDVLWWMVYFWGLVEAWNISVEQQIYYYYWLTCQFGRIFVFVGEYTEEGSIKFHCDCTDMLMHMRGKAQSVNNNIRQGSETHTHAKKLWIWIDDDRLGGHGQVMLYCTVDKLYITQVNIY